jgi:hypothetical protein
MTTEERDERMILLGVEKEHVRSTNRLFGRLLAKFAEVSGEIDGLSRLCRGRIAGQLSTVVDVQISAAFFPGIGLIGQPHFIGGAQPDVCSQQGDEQDQHL